ncbi:hypothetical protein B0H10DRAFT_2208712 [Mycena sp. CBHHK59/15]|nr:hypothetical protein B0H10DRAFT_2208712 [Mycena sp. CBHHK59/15]
MKLQIILLITLPMKSLSQWMMKDHKPGLKVVAAPPCPPTKEELRGDTKKWTHEHLPCGTASLFTSDVIPLAHEVPAGLEPWAKLSVANIQDVVTRAFPRAKDDPKPGPKYMVTEEDAPDSSESTAVKPCVFKFDTPEARADFAEWALEPEASETGQMMAFHWNQ